MIFHIFCHSLRHLIFCAKYHKSAKNNWRQNKRKDKNPITFTGNLPTGLEFTKQITPRFERKKTKMPILKQKPPKPPPEEQQPDNYPDKKCTFLHPHFSPVFCLPLLYTKKNKSASKKCFFIKLMCSAKSDSD